MTRGMTTMVRRDRFRDTPCAYCGHGHAGHDRFWSGNTRTFVERCGEWVSSWSWQRAEFWACECPEWRSPAHRCRCGKTSDRPFPAWLNGVRACSAGCAGGSR